MNHLTFLEGKKNVLKLSNSPKAFMGVHPGGAIGKVPVCQHQRFKRRRFDPQVRKLPWRRAWQHIFLPEESHGQRSLVCYSPWGRTELDMT